MEGEELILSTSSEGSPRRVRKGRGWTTLLVLAVAATTFGSSVPAGYNIGVINSPAHIIKYFCNETVFERYDMVLSKGTLEILFSCIVSIFIVGGVIGSLAGSWLADKCGRKGSIVITYALGIVAALFFILSRQVSSVEMLVLGRFVVGLSSGLATAVVPMYLTELAPLHLRGATGVMCPLGITIGVLFGQIMGLEVILGTNERWHYLLAFYALLVLLTATILPILPESPKYLSAIKHQEQRAIKELLRIRGRTEDQVKEEVELLKCENRGVTEESKWSTWRVLKSSELRLPLLLVCALQGGQQFSGINAVFYYSSTIFESAGLPTDTVQYANLGTGVVNVLVAVISIFTMNYFGRRPLAILSCIGAAAALCLLTLSITLTDSVSWMPALSIASVLLYVFLYGLGLGPIPYFIGSELFEVGPRPTAMALGSMSNWGGNLFVGMAFPSLRSLIKQYCFIIFVVIVLLLTVFLYFLFPETKDMDQHEIAEMLKDGCKSNIRVKAANRSDESKRLEDQPTKGTIN